MVAEIPLTSVQEFVEGSMGLRGCCNPWSKGKIILVVLLCFGFVPISFLYTWTNSDLFQLEGQSSVEHRYHENIHGTRASVFYQFQEIVSKKTDNNLCLNELITDIRQDPCYQEKSRIFQCECEAGTNISNRITYMIPNPRKNPIPLTEEELSKKVIFAFIHVNKAGGTTIKKDVLYSSMAQNSWSGASFGAYRSWTAMGDPDLDVFGTYHINNKTSSSFGDSNKKNEHNNNNNNNNNNRNRQLTVLGASTYHASGKLEVYECGQPRLLPAHYDPIAFKTLYTKCPFRIVWGANTMGLCQHFPGTPCVYFITLRDPIQRAISYYNYMCVLGSENRKGWLPAWKTAGRCPLSLRQFVQLNISSPQMLTKRLTRGCDSNCGARIALKNLMNPCLRYVVLEKMWDGLSRLRDTFGPGLHQAFAHVVRNYQKDNTAPYSYRTVKQINDRKTIDFLGRIMAADIALYKTALEKYEEKWKQPLTSCNK